MLSRYKGKGITNCVRCIAITASPSSIPPPLSKEEKEKDSSKKEEDEAWGKVLKSIPISTTSSRWRTFTSYGRQKPFDSDFFSSRRFGQSRKYTTDTTTNANPEDKPKDSKPSPDEPGSLFNSQESAWDHVFENIDELPPLSSMPVQSRPRTTAYRPPGAPGARLQQMTARELSVFESMFNMIFDAAIKQQIAGGTGAAKTTSISGRPRTAADRRAEKAARPDPLTGVGIGSGPEGTSAIGDLFGQLRRVSRAFRWSPQEDAELERKLAQMELCETDQKLLEWAAKEVFDESARYEEAARQALLKKEASKTSPETNARPSEAKSESQESSSESAESKSDSPDVQASAASDAESSPKPSFTSPLPLQPPFYPHLLTALIRTFREKFHDPHLALSIFEHARSRSIASYVFGCTAPAYNELLRTRWEAFRDLRSVADTLNEMRVNGIAPDGQTRALVEQIRRDVGARTVWQEERNIGTGEVLELLNQIETLSREPLKQRAEKERHDPRRQRRNRSKVWRSTDEEWKLKDGKHDRGYKFGDWDLSNSRPRRKPKYKYSNPGRDSLRSSRDKLAFE